MLAVHSQSMTTRETTVRSGRYPVERLALMGLEFGMAGAAVSAGLLLSVRPDGAFLHTDRFVLRRTPFKDWRLPGLLLAAGCGSGFLATGLLHLRHKRYARLVSVAAGFTLIGLEAWEIAFIEYQPVEVLLAGIGAAIVVLALRLPPETLAAQGLGTAPATPRA